MDLIHCKKYNITLPFILGVGVLLASAFSFSLIAQAEVSEAQIQGAIQELSTLTGQNIASEDQAKDLCNKEQYLDVCADIGKKHNLYTQEEVKQVNAFLDEVKGKILEDIKSCPDEGCLIRVANELSRKMQTKNSTLATNLNLTAKLIDEKKSVIDAANEAGVSFRDCESMNPDTAPIELLRKCAKLSKDSRVQKYIPEEKRVLTDQFSDTTLVLREALAVGKYQCGDNTLEGCGNYCLKPGTSVATAGVPEVCKQIATEIFGPDGVKQLELAHQQVGQVKDYYTKKFILTLPDGKELIGEGQIRNACDRAFSERNLEIARACGNFAVQNGFAAQAEVDKGLRLMESFASKGQNVNFEDCRVNPTACRDFIPEDERSKFDAGNQIFEIMKTEIGFDPQQCERGSVDQAIGIKCLEGSRRALAKIESLGLANQSQEARFIIEDIKRHVSEGDNFTQKREQFKEVFNQQGGPGGCKSETECFNYCSNSANGPECIAFGAQQGVTGFRGEEAVQRFQEYNQNIQRPGLTSNEYKPFPPGSQYPQFPGQGPYPGFQPSGQDSRFTQPDPGFSPPPGADPYYPPPYPPPYPGPGPVGPSPECFAAIQSGDFIKAKTACEIRTNLPLPSFTPVGTPVTIPSCPPGQYWNGQQCQSPPTYSPGTYPTYTYAPSPLPQPGSAKKCFYPNATKNGRSPGYTIWCEADYYNCHQGDPSGAVISLDGLSLGAPSWCDSGFQGCNNNGFCDSSETPSSCPGDCSGITSSPYPSSVYSPYPTSPYPSYSPGSNNWINKTWKFKDGSTQYSSVLNRTDTEYISYVNGVYSDCLNKYFNGWKPGGGDQSKWQEFGIPVCSSTASTVTSPYPSYSPTDSSCSQSLISLLGSGCHQMYTDSSGRLVFCDGPMTKSAKEGDTTTTAGCSGGATYSPYPTYSPPVSGSCPSGYHYHSESGGFCINDQENYGGICYDPSGTSSITCPSQPTYSPYPTTTQTSGGSCPSGSHVMYVNNAGGYCMSDNDGTKCGPLNSTSVSGFGSCDTYAPTTSYTPYPNSSPASSCPSGQWWDSSTNSCKTATPYDTPTGGYCGDYACNNGETTSNCPSDCGGGTTYTPYPTSTYTPPPSCSSDQYWDGSACVANPTPYPTTDPSATCSSSGGTWDGSTCVYPTPVPSEPPPPTSGMYKPYMVAHCQQLGRAWDGSGCRANGLFARFYEYYFANAFRAFGLVK